MQNNAVASSIQQVKIDDVTSIRPCDILNIDENSIGAHAFLHNLSKLN